VRVIRVVALAAMILATVAVASATSASARVSTRRAHGAIVNGSPPTVDWPWIVALEDKTRQADELAQHFCGGALIRPHVVLTAAHCVLDQSSGQPQITAQDMYVIAGRQVLTDNTRGEKIDVSKIDVYPGDAQNLQLKGDVALLTLSRSASERPAAIATGTSWSGSGTIMGWGTTDQQADQQQDQLLAADVPLIGDTDPTCGGHYGSDYNPDLMKCAGGNGTADTCRGDSGGPLAIHDAAANDWTVAGVTSFGDGCNPSGVAGIYAWAAGPTLRPWIMQTADSLEASATAPAPAPAPGPAVDAVAPVLSKLSLSPATFKAARRGASIASPIGTKVRYTMSEDATVRFTIRRVGHPRRALRRLVARPSRAGVNWFVFTGYLKRPLAPGRYRLVAQATDAAGNKSATESVGFQVVSH
jgi:secreted trypsin-like serine protease